MKNILKLKNILFFKLIVVFFIFFAIFLFIEFSNSLLDIDTYYHIKYAELLRTEGASLWYNFPWLGFTIFKDYPTDLSFLYHIFLVPFASGNLIVGAKIAAALLAAFLFGIFYYLLKKWKVSFAFLWTIILFVASAEFIFRLSSGRPLVLSIILALLVIYFLEAKKYLWLFLVSAIYILSYSGAIVILILLLSIYLIGVLGRLSNNCHCEESRACRGTTKQSHSRLKYGIASLPEPALRTTEGVARNDKKENFRTACRFALAILGGITAGLIARPDFPNIVYAILVQDFLTIFYKMQKLDLAMGMEMNPVGNIFEFLKNNLWVFLGFFIGTILLGVKFLKMKIEPKILLVSHRPNIRLQSIVFLTSLFFLFLTLNSQRFIEYWVPFTVLFAALTIGEFLSQEKASQMVKKILLKIYETPERLEDNKSILKIYAWGFGAIILSYAMFANIYLNIAWQKQNPSAERFKKASQWLIANTPKDSIVFNTSWGDFPLLFFNNTHNYYIVGMDPTFMYAYNKELYWKWRHITDEGMVKSTETGSPLKSQSVYDSIKNDFRSNYIFIDKQRYYYSLKRIIEQDERFKKVYEDKETEIWELL